jgi:hypothetical protein
VLDPVDRFSEMLYGLFIALSIPGSISVAAGGARDVRLLLVGALGANIAWGIVDAVMYVMEMVLRRARVRATERAIRVAPDAERGRRLVAEELPADLVDTLTVSELEARSAGRSSSATRPTALVSVAGTCSVQQPSSSSSSWRRCLRRCRSSW